MNAFVGVPLSAVSATPGTTRSRIVGLSHHDVNDARFHVMWLDVPGWLAPDKRRTRLAEAMHQQAVDSSGDVDCVVFLQDATLSPERAQAEFARARECIGRDPEVVILTKIDLLKEKKHLLPKIQAVLAAFPGAAVVPMSVISKDPRDYDQNPLLKELFKFSKVAREDEISEEELTLNSSRSIAQDWIRGAILSGLRNEVPMSLEVCVDEYKVQKNGISVRATVLVERDSQKGIVIGDGGGRLKRAGEKARLVLAEVLGQEVHVMLRVKAMRNWQKTEEVWRELGY
jgi:GTP-binding protein Era